MEFECSCSWEQEPGCVIETNKERTIYYCPKCKQPLSIKKDVVVNMEWVEGKPEGL